MTGTLRTQRILAVLLAIVFVGAACTPAGTPTRPGNLRIQSTSGNSVTIQWDASTDSDGTVRGYNVYRDNGFVASVAGTSYTDPSAVGAHRYYVIAYDDASPVKFSARSTELLVNPNIGPPDGYQEVFGDEFNGGSLDAGKWRTAFDWGPDIIINNEEQYYVDTQTNPGFGYSPFSFDGQSLNITAVRTPPSLLAAADNQAYLSGVISSDEDFSFTHGYVEARVKVPAGRGLWPAFWMLNIGYDQGESEIDIMEFLGHQTDTAYQTFHYETSPDVWQNSGTHADHSSSYFPGGFHTFAALWEPGKIRYYVDGVQSHEVNSSYVSNRPMYLLANLAVGGNWPGSPNASTSFPASYKIDYIRVYKG